MDVAVVAPNCVSQTDVNGPIPAARQRSAADLVRDHLFICVASTAILIYMWLTAEIRIVPAYGPHDMTNYLEHARSITAGRWFGSYDVLTLIKRPFFPVFLALIDDFGISLTLGHKLLYIAACLAACAAVRPIVKAHSRLSLLFIVLLFNPFMFNDTAWIANRSQVNPSLALFVVTCSVGIFVRRGSALLQILPWSIGLGFALAAFWLTREEAVWIVPCVVILLGAYAVHMLRRERPAWLARSVLLACPLVIFVVCVGSVAVLNGIRYGWYTIDEQTAPEFMSAYNSLARIKTAPVPLVPVPKAAREIAYRVSPAARELEPGLDEERSAIKRWIGISCKLGRVCSDYGGGFFVWAFREAVSYAGNYASGSTARDYYRTLASQIDAACDSKRIECWPKAFTTMPPVHLTDLPSIAARFWEGTVLLTAFERLNLTPPAYQLPPPNILTDYELVVRSIAQYSDDITFNGWLVHKPMKAIVAEGSDGSTVPIAFLSSPDVHHVFAVPGKRDSMDSAQARFSVTTVCKPACFIVATDSKNRSTRIRLDIGAPEYKDANFVLHIDGASGTTPFVSGDDGLKSAALRFIGWLYQLLIPWFAAATAALVGFRLIEWNLKGDARAPEYPVIVVAVAASSGCFTLLLAIMSALTYYSFFPEYMSPMYPILLFACSAAICTELQAQSEAMVSRQRKRAFDRISPGGAPRPTGAD